MNPQRSAERQRRSGVEACLARWELLRRPHRLEAGASGATLGRRLRGAFEELGPVFSAFGLYLASRVDLLAVGDALELASLSDRVPPLPAGAVHERIVAELGRPFANGFADLEAEPFESRLFLQAHRGRLAGGEPVIVRLVREDTAEGVEADLEVLPLAGEALVAQGWTAAAVKDTLEGFRQHLHEQADLRPRSRTSTCWRGTRRSSTPGRAAVFRVSRRRGCSRSRTREASP